MTLADIIAGLTADVLSRQAQLEAIGNPIDSVIGWHMFPLAACRQKFQPISGSVPLPTPSVEYIIDNCTGADGASVTAIPDSSGNGLDIVGGAGALMVLAGPNGHKALDFNHAVTAVYANASVNVPQAALYFIVFKMVTDGFFSALWDSVQHSGGTGRCLYSDSTVRKLQLYNGDANHIADPSALAKDVYHVVDALYNGASSDLYVDGVLVASGDLTATEFTGFTMGTFYNGVQPWVGTIARVNIYPSAAQRDAIRASMMAWAGI